MLVCIVFCALCTCSLWASATGFRTSSKAHTRPGESNTAVEENDPLGEVGDSFLWAAVQDLSTCQHFLTLCKSGNSTYCNAACPIRDEFLPAPVDMPVVIPANGSMTVAIVDPNIIIGIFSIIVPPLWELLREYLDGGSTTLSGISTPMITHNPVLGSSVPSYLKRGNGISVVPSETAKWQHIYGWQYRRLSSRFVQANCLNGATCISVDLELFTTYNGTYDLDDVPGKYLRDVVAYPVIHTTFNHWVEADFSFLDPINLANANDTTCTGLIMIVNIQYGCHGLWRVDACWRVVFSCTGSISRENICSFPESWAERQV